MYTRVKKNLKADAGLKSLLFGGGISFFMQVLGMLLGYALFILIANLFGAKTVGIYSISFAMLTMITMVSSLGLDTLILKRVGRLAKNSKTEFLGKAYRIAIPAAAVSSVLVIMFAWFFLDRFFDEYQYKRYFLVVGILVVFSTFTALNIEYLRAKNKIFFSEFFRHVLRPLLIIITMLILGLFRRDEYIPGYALFFAVILTCLVSFVFIIKFNKKAEYVADHTEEVGVPALLQSSFPMLISALAYFMIANMTLFFVGIYESSFQAGLIAIAIKLAGLINMPLMVLNKVCAPRFSRLYWEQKRSELQKYIAQVTMFAFYGALLIGAGLFFLSDYILAVFGQEFLQAYDLLLVLMIGQIVSCASGSVGVFMLMTGNEKAYRNITLLTAAGAFLAYIVVLPVHGLMGAALISSFSLIILNGISVLYIRIRLGYLTLYLPLLGRFLKTGYEKT